MALNAYLHLKGQKQGEIKGSVTQKGREGTVLIIEASHEILAPVSNPGSGAVVGKRIHRPFVITKELDKSSPLLYQAMINMENFANWQLDFYGAALTGLERLEYTVVLTDAVIIDIRFQLPNIKRPETVKLNPYEVIDFTYQTIQWTWTDGGITALDKWQ